MIIPPSLFMPYDKELQVAIEAVLQACLLCSTTQAELTQGDSLSKEDKSPVTVADFGAQALVFERLRTAFPADPAVGEEDSAELRDETNVALRQEVLRRAQHVNPRLDEAGMLSAIDRGNHAGGASGRFWTLDPIDGTKGFLRGDQYAIALALIENGKVVLGVLGCPNLAIDPSNPESDKGALLYAVSGSGTSQCPISDPATAEKIHTDSVTDPAQASFCESVESEHTAHGRSYEITRKLGTQAEPFRMDSQCKYAAVARGQASVYLRLPTRPGYEEKIWDHAAGSIVLEEAGGRLSDTFGKPLDFSLGRTLKNNKGVVAASSGVFEAIVEAVVSTAP